MEFSRIICIPMPHCENGILIWTAITVFPPLLLITLANASCRNHLMTRSYAYVLSLYSGITTCPLSQLPPAAWKAS